MGLVPAPRADEVHVWRAPLDDCGAELSALARSLSPEECGRALRFQFAGDRRRFVACRGWLRRLLAGYLDIDAAAIGFGENAFGKPRLTTPATPWLHFNVSHSGGMAVFAVARDHEVGVDVEQVHDDFPVDAVAHRFFTRREQETLDASPPGHRVDVAFALWTRKEAYLKGIGVGFATEQTARGRALEECSDWSVAAFDAGTGFIAAVAVEGRGVHVPAAAQPLSLAAYAEESDTAVKANLGVVEVPSFESDRRAGQSNLSARRGGLRVLRTTISEWIRPR
jgi:4'-phosphopantetheinyl transferase